MNKSKLITAFCAAFSVLTAPAVFAQATITVNADKPGHAVSP